MTFSVNIVADIPIAAHMEALHQLSCGVAEQVESLIDTAEAARAFCFDADAIIKRALRAGYLVAGGRVLPPVPFQEYGGCLGEVARVQGSKEYIITYDMEHCYCDCPDFRFGNAPKLPSGQVACKHILAFLIAESIQQMEEIEHDEF